MILLYSGLPGSGKSLHQAVDICRFLHRKDTMLITNYPLNLTKQKRVYTDYRYIDNATLSPGLLVRLSIEHFNGGSPKEGKIRLYLDEAQLLFGSRDWQRSGRSDWLAFFTQHRKLGYDIYLIAQANHMLDKQLRSLVEYEVIHRKVGRFGWAGTVLSFLAGGRLHVAIWTWLGLKQRIRTDFFRASRKYTAIYNTLETFGQSENLLVSAVSECST